MCCFRKKGSRKRTVPITRPVIAWRVFASEGIKLYALHIHNGKRYHFKSTGWNRTREPSFDKWGNSTSGFYAYKSKRMASQKAAPRNGDVVYKVALAGVVVAHRNGYQAEKLKMVEE